MYGRIQVLLLEETGYFLRKYLFKYVINDRGAIYKRDHTTKLQEDLTKVENIIEK